MFVVVDMLLAHNFSCALDNRLRQTDLASNLHRKTTTCLTYRQLEQRFKLTAVIEHRAIDNTFGTLSQVFEIAIVGSDNTKSMLLVELRKHSFGYWTTNHRFGTCTKLVNQQECLCIGITHKMFHITQVRWIGREVILNRLLITYINQELFEKAHLAGLAHRHWQTALQHILQHRYSLQAHRLTTRVRATNNQYSVIREADSQGDNGLTLTTEIEQ